jgi:hypothetical protein
VDDGSYFAEELKFARAFEDDCRVGRIGGFKANRSFHGSADLLHTLPERLYGEITVDGGNHDIAVSRIEGTIHNKKVAIVDPPSGHRVALHTAEIRRRRPLDEKFVQIELRFKVLFRRTRKSGDYRTRYL